MASGVGGDDLQLVRNLNTTALELVAEGQPNAALVKLTQAIRLAPDYAESYLNRASVFDRIRLPEKAEADRRRASELTAPPTGRPERSGSDSVVCQSCGGFAPAVGRCPVCWRLHGELVYAGFWIRLLAFTIDQAILFIVVFSLTVLVTLLLASEQAYIIASPIISLLGVPYFLGFVAARGATPGKMVVGIEIIKANGDPFSGLGRAFVRGVSQWVNVLTLGAGYAMIAFDRRKRGFHDYIARTVVVRGVRAPSSLGDPP